jgi:hypothetical protein
MERQFQVEQPPLADKYRLLIDRGDEEGTYGLATDRDKVIYNLELLDLYGQVQSTAPTTGEGISLVLAAGRYVGIAKVSADLSQMSMELFDCRVHSDIKGVGAPALYGGYPEPVVRGLEELGAELAASFSEAEDDLVELARV